MGSVHKRQNSRAGAMVERSSAAVVAAEVEADTAVTGEEVEGRGEEIRAGEVVWGAAGGSGVTSAAVREV